MTLRLELLGISKQYPAVKANDDVSLRVKPGEIHAVLGENGTSLKARLGATVGPRPPAAAAPNKDLP